MLTHRGGCHCGAVRFEVEAPAVIEAHACNCSVCEMSGFLHLIVPAPRFRLVCGEPELITCTFNTGVARRPFCRHCGVKSFYIPRSNPDGLSVNVRCLDHETVEEVRIEEFDGRHWEANAGRLAHLSREEA